MAYDIGVVRGIVASLNRTGEPGVGPGAGIGNGAVALVRICPKRLANLERAIPCGIGTVFIL